MSSVTREEMIELVDTLDAALILLGEDEDSEHRVRARIAVAALQAAVPAAWQFYEDGEWHSGDRKIAGYRRNTEAAGIPVRDLFALPCLPAKTPDEWHGHKFKEIQAGKWRCECGKEINEARPDKAQVPEGYVAIGKSNLITRREYGETASEAAEKMEQAGFYTYEIKELRII